MTKIKNEAIWARLAERYYQMGFYDKDLLVLWVKANRLSPETFEKITGVNYETFTNNK